MAATKESALNLESVGAIVKEAESAARNAQAVLEKAVADGEAARAMNNAEQSALDAEIAGVVDTLEREAIEILSLSEGEAPDDTEESNN